MNFLAHAYLSFDDPEILVGNMISDFVKGAKKFSFSGKIQEGISLHRAIDDYTDTHPATRKAREFFRPSYRLYSGAVMDVLYDHFLANDPFIFDDSSLKKFTARVYHQLEEQASALPNNFLQVFSYMRIEDWLYHYRHKEGIRKSLGGLVRRSAYLTDSSTAYQLFLDHYSELNECYKDFIEDVKQFAKQRFDLLSS
ncbi:MAG: ACP phosphodiesterase [Flavisolibacter sp.]